MEGFRFVDLFAGLGGFHVALDRLGGRCVFASEWKDHLRDLYESNFGIRPNGDLTKVRVSEIPDHDVLAAGFPCQPFSKAGDQLGFECTEQGTLFFDVVKILKAKKPKYFILENVPNLIKHNDGKTWKKMQHVLGPRGLGYEISAERLSPHNFGIPQIRERLYIVGSSDSLANFRWPEKLAGETSIESVLDERPRDAKPLSERATKCLVIWNEFLKRCPSGVELPSFPLWSMEWGATYPFEDETPYARRKRFGAKGLLGFKGSHGRKLGLLKSLEKRWLALPSHARTMELRFPKWKKDFIRQNRQFYFDNKKWIDPWVHSVVDLHSSHQKFEWNIKGGERDLWQHVLQFRASGIRVKRRTTAPSLVAMTDTQVPIVAWERRYMTVRECARLQSLDLLQNLPESSGRAFEALGNAVNARVVQMIACSLLGSNFDQKLRSTQKRIKKTIRPGTNAELVELLELA